MPKPSITIMWRNQDAIKKPWALASKPILENNPDWIELYYKSWELAWSKIQFGNEVNGFAPRYLDEGFNKLIFQWDTNFMTAFAVYGKSIFPVMESKAQRYESLL